MEKVFFTIRNPLMLLGTLVFTFFMVYSCSNEEEYTLNDEIIDHTAEPKAWLSKNHSDVALILEWNKAVKQQVEGLTIVEVPLVCAPGQYGINDPSLLEGLEEQYWDHPVRVEFIINSKNEVTSGLIYSVVPTIAYMEQRSFSYNDISRTQPKDLDGVIYIFGLNDEPLKIDLFEKGRLAKSYFPSSGEELDELGKDFARLMRMSSSCAPYCRSCNKRGHSTVECGTKWIESCAQCHSSHLAGQCVEDGEDGKDPNNNISCPSCGSPYPKGTNHNCSGSNPDPPTVCGGCSKPIAGCACPTPSNKCSTCGATDCWPANHCSVCGVKGCSASQHCSYCGVKGCNINNHPICPYCGHRDCNATCVTFCEDCGQVEGNCHCYTENPCKVCGSKECDGMCGGFCVWCSNPKGRCTCDEVH